MKKIPTLFIRDFENDPSRVLPEVTPGCEWVINGEGIATRKWDGVAVRISYADDKSLLCKRLDVKNGRTAPPGFEPCGDPDPATGHWPGWVAVDPNDKANKWILEAYGLWFNNNPGKIPPEGTWEVCGPKIGTRAGINPENLSEHHMFMHGSSPFEGDDQPPTDFLMLQAWLGAHEIEGIVWHHPDGRMCKIKKSDFGLKW